MRAAALQNVLIKVGRYVKALQISGASPAVSKYFAGCMSKHICSAYLSARVLLASAVSRCYSELEPGRVEVYSR